MDMNEGMEDGYVCRELRREGHDTIYGEGFMFILSSTKLACVVDCVCMYKKSIHS
jgi:hypothetical protein